MLRHMSISVQTQEAARIAVTSEAEGRNHSFLARNKSRWGSEAILHMEVNDCIIKEFSRLQARQVCRQDLYCTWPAIFRVQRPQTLHRNDMS